MKARPFTHQRMPKSDLPDTATLERIVEELRPGCRYAGCANAVSGNLYIGVLRGEDINLTFAERDEIVRRLTFESGAGI